MSEEEMKITRSQLEGIVSSAVSAAVEQLHKLDKNIETKLTVPSFQGKNEEEYKEYKMKIEIWLKATEGSTKKKSAAMIGALSGKALESLKGIDLDELMGEDGTDIILKQLDKRFGQSKMNEEYQRTLRLLNIKQGQTEQFKEYTVRFDSYLKDCQRDKEIVLKGSMCAHLLIDRSRMSDMERKMILTQLERTKEEEMYEHCMKAMNNVMESLVITGAEKEENRQGYLNKDKGKKKLWCEVCQKQGHTKEKCWWSEDNQNKCFNCWQEGHFARNCITNKKGNEAANSNKYYLQMEKESEDDTTPASINAILDTGSIETVMGER